MIELRFPVDQALRQRLLPWGSLHEPVFPAKMSLGLLAELIHRYTRPGEVVLDPFFGCGSTMLASLEGRHVVGVELEPHWIECCRRNAAHLAGLLVPPTGEIVIRQGDSRYDLAAAFMPPFAEAIVTSPPYLTAVGGDHGRDPHPERIDGGRGLAEIRAGYADAILTSPPYADRYATSDPERDQANDPTAGVKGRVHRPYSTNSTNIGNLRRYGSVDAEAALTTPPAGQTYLEAMALVYAGCHAALKPGGVCVVVVGNVVRDGREVRLDLDTERLLAAAGFVPRERLIHRKRPSFFRQLLRQRKPDLPYIDCETVIVAEKPANRHELEEAPN